MKKIVIAFLLSIISLSLRAQSGIYVFEDGKKIPVQVVNSHPDKGRNAAIYAGAFFGPEMYNFFGASYYKPQKSYFNIIGGPYGGIVDANWLFSSKGKPINLTQSVHMSGNTRYMVEIPTEKRVSYGVHYGASYYNYEDAGFSAAGLIGGLTLLRAKHCHWLIDSRYKEAQGTAVSRLNADITYYPYRQSTYIEDAENLDERARKVGFRVYFDGKATIWSRKGHLAFHYMLGYGWNADKEGSPVILGLGLGYSFL